MILPTLKKIDIFGMTFNFTTLGKEKFVTNISCLMTFLCFITISIFTLLFGRNFYYRENPFVLKQLVVPENYSELFPISNENFFFAWRISDVHSKTYNYTVKFNPELYYYRYNNLNNTRLSYIKLESVPCSTQEYFNAEFAKSYKPEIWQCIDWKKYNNTAMFGGGWDEKEIGYFFFGLYLNKNRFFTNTSLTDGSTLTLQELKDEIDSGVYVDFVYTEYNFSPSNYNIALSRTFKNYYYKLDFSIRKNERLYVEEVLMKDDRGWIFEDKNDTKMYSTKEKTTDFKFFKEEDYGKVGLGTEMYLLLVYSTKPYTLITRSYMKIQDLAAIVGGF